MVVGDILVDPYVVKDICGRELMTQDDINSSLVKRMSKYSHCTIPPYQGPLKP